MNTERIEIDYRNILQRIYTHTYYTGESRKTAGAPPHFAARIQASDSDKRALTHHIHLAIAEATKMLTRFLGICTTIHDESTSQTNITIELPLNYPTECIRQIAVAIEDYATMRTIGEWMTQNKPDEATLAAEGAQMAAMRLRELMSIRKRPYPRTHKDDNNIEI